MKKSMKALISAILCLMILSTAALTAFASDSRTISNIHEAYALVHETELVRIFKASLHTSKNDTKGTDVYYVVCRGLDFTEFDPTQPRSYASAILIGLSNENNAYVKALRSIVKNNVPVGSKLVFVGHSMGGMVLQQLIARSDIKRDYDILYSLSLGSPYILTLGTKEGTLRRCIDEFDPIPFLSLSLLGNPYRGEVAVETSFLPLVHFSSYESGACWDNYDCLGYKNGSAYIVLGEQVYG